VSKDFQFEQFCRLGERIGDGDLEGEEKKWIEKEYKKLSKILIKDDPDLQKYYRKQRQERSEIRNRKMKQLMEKFKCTKCNGKLRQSRSGSYVAYCKICSARYKAK